MWIDHAYLLCVHQEIIWPLDRRTAGKRVDRVVGGWDGRQMALVRLGKPGRPVTGEENSLDSRGIVASS